MTIKTIKNTLTTALALSLLFAIANSAYAIEATYLCPSPVELRIVNAPVYDDRFPMKYSGVMTGKVTGLDPANPVTDVMWDHVPITGQTADEYSPKTNQEQNNIKITRATLASDKVFCEYQLRDGQAITLGTTRNLLVPVNNCDKIKTAEGLLGFQCKK